MAARRIERVRKRALPGLIVSLVALAAASSFAEARERARPAARPAPSALERSTLEGPRFFSIAAVLARRDGVAGETAAAPAPSPARLAATGPAQSDSISRAERSDPFTDGGYRLFPSASPAVSGKWSAMRTAITRDIQRAETCRTGNAACREPSVAVFNAILGELRGRPRAAQVATVNRRVNAAIRYMSDATRHGAADVWSGPLAVLGAAGDCEDYAFAKYALLQAAGVPASAMRVVLLRDRRAGEDHAVLAVQAGDGWQILDNRWDRIDADGELPHYRPVFAMTGETLSMFAAPFVQSNGSDDLFAPATGWDAEDTFDLRALAGPEIARAL